MRKKHPDVKTRDSTDLAILRFKNKEKSDMVDMFFYIFFKISSYLFFFSYFSLILYFLLLLLLIMISK